jgi:tRNA U34 5-carboxymethylaminomethyl modifying enzyme MnmG/GidA
MPVLALPNASMMGFTCRMRSSRFLFGAYDKIYKFQLGEEYRIFFESEIKTTENLYSPLENNAPVNYSVTFIH